MNATSPNVLISCAGRRNYLIKQFADALDGRGRVVATDASPDAVALAEADLGIVVPPVFERGYIETILEICQRHNIGLVIPVNDHELPILATERSRFLQQGVDVVVSGPEVIATCFDKLRTRDRLAEIGVKVPVTFTTLGEAETALHRESIRFPLIVKPRWGSGSFGVFIVNDHDELRHACALLLAMAGDSLFQSYGSDSEGGVLAVQQLVRGTEYGLDVVNDLTGRHVTTFVKQKLGMRSGETDKAVTVHDSEIEALGRRVGEALGHLGNLDCDVMRSGDELYVLDLNPRFGGGYPFSHLAGANVPAAILAWSRGEALKREWLAVRSGVASAKCDRLVEIPRR